MAIEVELGSTAMALTVVTLHFRTIDGPDRHEITLPTDDAIDLHNRYRPRISEHPIYKEEPHGN